MSSLGFSATEFGPDGFLADEPRAKADQLASYGMRAVGGFLPILLHDSGHDPMPEVDAFIDACLASGADVVVLAAYSGTDGYDARPVLDDDRVAMLLDNLDRISARAEERGVIACLHPHIGTMIETAEEVDRTMAGSAGRSLRRHRPPRGRRCRPGRGDGGVRRPGPARASQGRRPRPGEAGHRRRRGVRPRGARTACSGRSAKATSTSSPWSHTLEARRVRRLVRPRAGRDARRRANRAPASGQGPGQPRLPGRGDGGEVE